MPKMKTRSSVKKRFHITGSGKVLRMKSYRGHNKTKKNNRQLFAMGDMQPVNGKKRIRTIRRALPCGD